MNRLALRLVQAVGVLHLLIGGFEMLGARTLATSFGFRAEAELAASVVRNAGLYNLFVAFLIFWALRRSTERGRAVILLCLGFVVLAGIFGAITLGKPLVLLLQTLPAAAALWALRRDR